MPVPLANLISSTMAPCGPARGRPSLGGLLPLPVRGAAASQYTERGSGPQKKTAGPVPGGTRKNAARLYAGPAKHRVGATGPSSVLQLEGKSHRLRRVSSPTSLDSVGRDGRRPRAPAPAPRRPRRMFRGPAAAEVREAQPSRGSAASRPAGWRAPPAGRCE